MKPLYLFLGRLALAASVTALPLACGFPDYGGFQQTSTTTGTGGAAPTVCPTGFKDCNTNPADGCEVDVTGDAKNCGDCGTACDSTNGTASCVDKVCKIKCGTGYADCDMLASNGCEVDTGNDVTHCGSCTIQCPTAGATASCTVGKCGFTCKPGFGDCDMKADNACEASLVTNTDCGTCGNPCNSPGSVTSCSTGTCKIANCTPPLDDCDGNVMNGCEADTSLDTSNCGKCANVCGMQNAPGTTCAAGMCVETCAAGYGNCDNLNGNGCEAKVTNDINNCGACGMVCAVAGGTPTCTGSTCAVGSCTTPNQDCDGMYSTGCESNGKTDVNNCGTCGKACTNAHGTTACSNSLCVPVCAMGFADCDGNPVNGCETPTTTVTNCGGCGMACNSVNGTATCPGGTCTLACTGNFQNCDGNGVNGCESNKQTDKNNCGACNNACVDPMLPYCLMSNCGACPAVPAGDEPNELIQAPSNPPMTAGVEPGSPANKTFDANNTFPLLVPRGSVSHSYTFATDTDVDVHYLDVTDDAGNGYVPGITIGLTGIPAGATYELNTYYYCTVAPNNVAVLYNYAPPAPQCVPQTANTGTLGSWYYCDNPATSGPPLFSEFLGYKCNYDVPGNPGGMESIDSGILQIEVKMLNSPSAQACTPYTLTVNVAKIMQ